MTKSFANNMKIENTRKRKYRLLCQRGGVPDCSNQRTRLVLTDGRIGRKRLFHDVNNTIEPSICIEGGRLDDGEYWGFASAPHEPIMRTQSNIL